jgi:aspartyl-tRNA(Asn)/glutamyl-tRNA(Gln) amidotransferase subunit A
VRDRLLAGAMLPGAWYVRAQTLRRWFRAEVLRLFREVDAIICPATPCRAPRLGQKTFVLDGTELPVRPNLGMFTQPLSSSACRSAPCRSGRRASACRSGFRSSPRPGART